MRISAATLALDFTEPSITAAKAIAGVIANNGSLQRITLLWAMEQAYGGSSADGRWSLRDAYDVLELAQVFHLENAILLSEPALCLAELVELIASLPTHTVRSEEQIALQQFSTPAPIAYLATLAAHIAPTDLVLEPSAGTGLLAIFARRAGARLVLNELDSARADMLQAAFPGVAVTRHDAELIHDLLAPGIRPTAVLINPPFSRSVGRHADPLAALRHLRAVLTRLAPGGRCAANRRTLLAMGRDQPRVKGPTLDPPRLPDDRLEHLIQSRRDLAVVEALRVERERRAQAVCLLNSTTGASHD